MNEFCSHHMVLKVEETTKGSLAPTDHSGPIPDLVNTFWYRCLVCKAVLQGKFVAPK